MITTDKRKVVLIGTGMVGMSYAYALLNQNACEELVLLDIDKKRAQGEAMDLNHGLAFSGSHMRIYAGDYDDCRDADIVAICAGVAQKPGETRLFCGAMRRCSAPSLSRWSSPALTAFSLSPPTPWTS